MSTTSNPAGQARTGTHPTDTLLSTIRLSWTNVSSKPTPLPSPHGAHGAFSGGVNTWENAWRRLIKNYPNSPHRYAPQSPVIPVDWSTSQKPGRLSTTWRYDSGGGGEIRSFYDRGTPDEMDYFQPTKRSYTFKRLLAKNFAYIAGPNDLWFTQDHHFYADEAIAKSIVLINDLRKPQTFKVNWKASIAGADIASGNDEATVQPAETHHIQFHQSTRRGLANRLEITATVITADNETSL